MRTKSVYDPAEPEDGERVLVTRYWPRGLSRERLACSEWLRDLAPSIGLLKAWKAGSVTWVEYVRRYEREMAARDELVGTLAERARRGPLTLLCFEAEADPHCHRHLLRRMIEDRSGGRQGGSNR